MFGVLTSWTGVLQLSDHEKANSELLIPCTYPSVSSCPVCILLQQTAHAGSTSGLCGEELGRGQEAVPVEQHAPMVLDCGPEPGRCLTRIRCLLQMWSVLYAPSSHVLLATSICTASLFSEPYSLQTLSKPSLQFLYQWGRLPYSGQTHPLENL